LPVDSARKLGVAFDTNLSFAKQCLCCICYRNIRDLRRISNATDQTTACKIATPLIHSTTNYCNFLLRNLPATQTGRLQLVLNSAARAVTKTLEFHRITPYSKISPQAQDK